MILESEKVKDFSKSNIFITSGGWELFPPFLCYKAKSKSMADQRTYGAGYSSLNLVGSMLPLSKNVFVPLALPFLNTKNYKKAIIMIIYLVFFPWKF